MKQPDQQQPQRHRHSGGNQARHHERMVEEIFADMRRPGPVEIDGGYDGRIVRDKEISVYGGKQRDQHIGRDAEGDS